MSQAVMAKFTEVELVPGHLPQECCEVLCHIVKTCLQSGECQESSDIIETCRFYLQRQSLLHASKEAVSQQICVPVDKLERNLVMLISAYRHLEHMQRQQVVNLCKSGLATPLCYLDISRYDETPMRVSFKNAFSMCFQSSVQHLQEEAPGFSLEALQKDLAKYMRQEAALCK
eukprot:3596568-Amphidinium_carterae.1